MHFRNCPKMMIIFRFWLLLNREVTRTSFLRAPSFTLPFICALPARKSFREIGYVVPEIEKNVEYREKCAARRGVNTSQVRDYRSFHPEHDTFFIRRPLFQASRFRSGKSVINNAQPGVSPSLLLVRSGTTLSLFPSEICAKK